MTSFSIVVLSFALGALFGYRMRQQNTKERTFSASHNTGSPQCEQCKHYHPTQCSEACQGCRWFHISRFTQRAGAR
jgi:hypothetical protein